jgi:S1-C subfamily serine protease
MLTAERRAKILEQARGALVGIELYLKHPTDDDGDGPGGLGETVSSQTLDRQQEQAIRFKTSIHFMGVVVAPRQVLVPDTGIDPRRIARWEVTDSSGRKTSARRAAMLRDAPALVLEPTDREVTWPAPTFADTAVSATSTFTLVVPRWSATDLRWSLSTSTAAASTDWSAADAAANAGRPAGPYWIVGSFANRAAQYENPSASEPGAAAFNLIFSPAGELLGAGIADRIVADRSTPPWRGADLIAAARITDDEWETIRDRTREQLSPTLYPVRIEFRRPKSLPITIPESDRLGWAVSDRMLLVPGSILPGLAPRQLAAWIGKISIRMGDNDVEAEFVGHMKDFDAILVKLPDSAEPLPARSDLSRVGKIEPYRPLVAITINRKYGANDLRTEYTRTLGMEYVFGNRLSPRLTPAPPIGSLVLDPDGKLIGLFARQRRSFEELEVFEQQTQGGQGQSSSSVELFGPEFIARAVADPSSAIDRRVVRRDEKDQDRRVWLGVEFNSLTRELAESLGCRKESKDGAVGLMISHIYAGSPAEQVGLRGGDVLLWFDVPERDRPVRLTRPGGGSGGRGRFDPSQFRGGDFGGQGSRTPWPAQNNYLNNLLATIGEGTPVRLSFWRDGKLNQLEVTIAQAPPDQDSAEQFKDESLGITVKELTYEVRSALQLKPDDPGVVVSKVESGTAAGRARIEPFEILQAADGEAIKSPAEFEAIVKKAQEDKKEQLRLTVVKQGRSRFADLKLTQ